MLIGEHPRKDREELSDYIWHFFISHYKNLNPKQIYGNKGIGNRTIPRKGMESRVIQSDKKKVIGEILQLLGIRRFLTQGTEEKTQEKIKFIIFTDPRDSQVWHATQDLTRKTLGWLRGGKQKSKEDLYQSFY